MNYRKTQPFSETYNLGVKRTKLFWLNSVRLSFQERSKLKDDSRTPACRQAGIPY